MFHGPVLGISGMEIRRCGSTMFLSSSMHVSLTSMLHVHKLSTPLQPFVHLRRTTEVPQISILYQLYCKYYCGRAGIRCMSWSKLIRISLSVCLLIVLSLSSEVDFAVESSTRVSCLKAPRAPDGNDLPRPKKTRMQSKSETIP